MLTNLQTLAEALGGEVNGSQVLAPGPGHSTIDRSLSVKLDSNAPDGFLTHSFSGDDAIICRDYVREKAGLAPFKRNDISRYRASEDAIERALMAAAALQSRNGKPKGRMVATYDYTDADGKLLYQVLRYEPKAFSQRRPDGNGGWIPKLEERRVPYRLSELKKFADASVFVCEGEKDADRVASLNLCVTTVAAGKWTDECVKALAGRDVIILEDNDDAGRAKALAAARALHGTAKTIRIVSLPDLPDKGDVSDWLDADPRRAGKFVDTCFEAPLWAPPNAATDVRGGNWKYYTGVTPTSPTWLIKGILPETGAVLMSGQWGTFKTTVALDLSVCVMADLPFANRYRVKRPGAVLYLALEGEGMLSARLSAIAAHHGVTGALPFAWRGDCPALMDKNAADTLCGISNEAAADLKRRFDLPVALIWIDTLITAASFASGEDNDAAAAQKVMTALRITSQRTGALVVGIDHFGKVVETGTRGSSAKEGAADAVIALLADREVNGGVKNTRLAVRKLRDGVSGLRSPLRREWWRPESTTTAILSSRQLLIGRQRSRPRGRRPLEAVDAIIAARPDDHPCGFGKNIRPFPDGPFVCACDVEVVRTEFYRQYPADGTEKQKADARRQAFNRSLRGSQAVGLVVSREVDGAQLVWLAKRGHRCLGHDGQADAGA